MIISACLEVEKYNILKTYTYYQISCGIFSLDLVLENNIFWGVLTLVEKGEGSGLTFNLYSIHIDLIVCPYWVFYNINCNC